MENTAFYLDKLHFRTWLISVDVSVVFIQVDNEAARLGTGLQVRTGVDNKSPCMKGTQRGGWPPRAKTGTPVHIKRFAVSAPLTLKIKLLL